MEVSDKELCLAMEHGYFRYIGRNAVEHGIGNFIPYQMMVLMKIGHFDAACCEQKTVAIRYQSNHFAYIELLYMILSRTATDSFTLNVRKAASARGLSVSIALGWEAAFLSFKLYYLWIIT